MSDISRNVTICCINVFDLTAPLLKRNFHLITDRSCCCICPAKMILPLCSRTGWWQSEGMGDSRHSSCSEPDSATLPSSDCPMQHQEIQLFAKHGHNQLGNTTNGYSNSRKWHEKHQVCPWPSYQRTYYYFGLHHFDTMFYTFDRFESHKEAK